jgi:transposase-like protein
MAPVNRKNPIRAASSESSYSLMEFMREFPDDDACLTYLWRTRYAPDGEHTYCARCDKERAFKKYGTAQQRQSWTCTGCGLHLHPTAGTIFEKSSTSLHLWFYAAYLMTSTRCGISAKQLERELGVTYKTAWRIMKMLRTAMADDSRGPLGGQVEADETYFSRSRRLGSHGRMGRSEGERTVFGMVERHGRIVVKHIPGATTTAITDQITTHVMPDAVVFTDEHPSYKRVAKRGYEHKRIKHSAKVYVDGDVHTQTIDGFWSLLKRGIVGVYHSVGEDYLQSYRDEYAWRYNHRNDPEAQFRTLLSLALGTARA